MAVGGNGSGLSARPSRPTFFFFFVFSFTRVRPVIWRSWRDAHCPFPVRCPLSAVRGEGGSSQAPLCPPPRPRALAGLHTLLVQPAVQPRAGQPSYILTQSRWRPSPALSSPAQPSPLAQATVKYVRAAAAEPHRQPNARDIATRYTLTPATHARYVVSSRLNARCKPSSHGSRSPPPPLSSRGPAACGTGMYTQLRWQWAVRRK
jgi:hypothetical protein